MRLKEHLAQLDPKLLERTTPEIFEDEFKDLELTEEEKQAAFKQALEDKKTKLRKIAYNEKISKELEYPRFSANELKGKLLASKTGNFKNYVIDKDNEEQINLLCMYFSRDPRLVACGFSLEKGVLLMGGLGVGKSHLMSFFMHNQNASYK